MRFQATNSRPPIVALLEARMSSELARLVEKHGGRALCVPAVRERASADAEGALALLDALGAGRFDVVIFATGVAVSMLFEIAENHGRRAALCAALRRVTTVCRGPKPSAALRGFGVLPTLTVREPFTAAEIIDALSELEVCGRRVLLFNYGERAETLSETLVARRAELEEFWLYRWEMPSDQGALEHLVERLVDPESDIAALAVTCQIQFRHLHQVAERLGLARELVRALNEKVAVGVVGPTCRAVLEAYGVSARVVPEHPKMGPLVIALMRQLEAAAEPAAVASSAKLESACPAAAESAELGLPALSFGLAHTSASRSRA